MTHIKYRVYEDGKYLCTCDNAQSLDNLLYSYYQSGATISGMTVKPVVQLGTVGSPQPAPESGDA